MNSERCYICNQLATSREHVPARGLFPAEKDIGLGQNFRRNLITVPSCELHNTGKSDDDEFLIAALSANVGSNAVAFLHLHSKTRRIFDRKGDQFMSEVVRNAKHIVLDNGNGNKFPVFLGKPNYDRLEKCFKNIACGIYFHEFSTPFSGEIQVILGFLKYQTENTRNLARLCETAFEAEGKNWLAKGENPQVFSYRMGEQDQFNLRALKMTFYEKVDVYVSFKPSGITPPSNLVMELINGGFPVRWKVTEDSEELRFNCEEE